MVDALSKSEKPTADPKPIRGRFDEITRFDGDGDVRAVLGAFSPALPEEMAHFDHADRGDAINWDLYDYDPRRELAVIQVRHMFRRYRNGYKNVRKTYHLVGFTERGSPFRHPVSAATVRAAARNHGEQLGEGVRAAERWIFNVSQKQHERAVRQGDLLMFPARGQPTADAVYRGHRLVLMDTHELRATAIWQDHDSDIWALEPAVYHVNNDHTPAYADEPDRWYVVRPGREADTYAFAQRIGG
jgi:hypothetical protein